MPLDLPSGARCFLDANIFYYHFVATPLLSVPCSRLIERIELGELTAYTSAAVLAEFQHKVMLSEAASRFGLTRTNLASWLQNHRGRISELATHLETAADTAMLRLNILPILPSTLVAAARISVECNLLTNDSVTVALMREHSISDLASNDSDFESVPGVRLWKPTPSARP